MARALDQSYDQLVEKAQEIFWVKGFKGVSVKALSEHLDVSQSVLYNKYSKEHLFMDSINYYISTYSDPFLKELRETEGGIKSLEEFFHSVVDALLNKTFPKSCLMVNTVVELRNEYQDITLKYSEYTSALKESYLVVLAKAVKLGQVKETAKLEDYAEYLMGMIFTLSVFYKVRTKEQLQDYIRQELSLLV